MKFTHFVRNSYIEATENFKVCPPYAEKPPKPIRLWYVSLTKLSEQPVVVGSIPSSGNLTRDQPDGKPTLSSQLKEYPTAKLVLGAFLHLVGYYNSKSVFLTDILMLELAALSSCRNPSVSAVTANLVPV